MAFKIYTKTGDEGQTALFGGRRVSKSHLRVDAYGTVDELNAFVGALNDACTETTAKALLTQIQHRLFSLGAHLASDPEKSLPAPGIEVEDIDQLEAAMDAMDEHLSPLRNFILPGGHPTVSICHQCRTVCRRAERLVVALQESSQQVSPLALQYLNRLSDYLFVLSRFLCLRLGVPETIWVSRK
jgi:cob(I)alamin adenosyltransferase